jgi:hypothetical protein
MAMPLRPHPFAALFPGLPPEELEQLARDIKERGQLEPIILHQGQILDGRNRYKACQLAGVKPRTEKFDAKTFHRNPEEFVLSRNLRRRHLSIGQRAAIALSWSEQIALGPETEKTKGLGRPKGTLSQAAKYIGVNEQRVFEVRQVREANPRLYQDVKAGRCSLNHALAVISPPRENGLNRASSKNEEPRSQESGQAPRGRAREQSRLIADKVTQVGRRPEGKSGERPSPSSAAVKKALVRIKGILGNLFYAEVQSRNLIQRSEEIVEFAKLSDAQMLEISYLLRKGWTFIAASREVVERLTPDDEIRALHTRAIASGGNWFITLVGGFGHLVVWGTEKDKTLAKLRDALARPSTLPPSSEPDAPS